MARCKIYDLEHSQNYKTLRKSLLELADSLFPDYRYTHSISLEPKALFLDCTFNYLQEALKEPEQFNSIIELKFNKLIQFFNRFDDVFETLYINFEEMLDQELQTQNEVHTADIFGQMCEKSYLYKFVNPEAYKSRLVGWILEQIDN